MILTLVFMFLVGWGAGIVTGLIGASAVGVVVPLLVVFLNFDPYVAIGVSLSIDVIASLVASYTYFVHDNVDLRGGGQIAVAAVIGAFVGSWGSSLIPSTSLGGLAGAVTVVIGVNFLRKPMSHYVLRFKRKLDLSFFKRRKWLFSIIFGMIIGLICGTMGAGGGIMILLVLVFIMDFSLHRAVGTSVLIMIFTALTGAVGHVIYGEFILYAVAIGCIGGAVGARSASKFANLLSEKQLGRMVGVIFIILGTIMILKELVV
jgi:hypothetical protein